MLGEWEEREAKVSDPFCLGPACPDPGQVVQQRFPAALPTCTHTHSKV